MWLYKQMALYQAYHKDKRNIICHFLGVPLIIFGFLSSLSMVTVITVVDFPIRLSSIIFIVLIAFYSWHHLIIGLFALILYLPVLVFAQEVWMLNSYVSWSLILCSFLIGSALQLFGHFLEGKKPAFLDNFIQVFIAPAFLAAEIIFLFGFLKLLRSTICELSLQVD